MPELTYWSRVGLDWMDIALRNLRQIKTDSENIMEVNQRIANILLETIAIYHNLPLDELKAGKKTEGLRIARQRFCYFADKYTNLTQVVISAMVNREHSIVIHSRKVVQLDAKQNVGYRFDLEKLEQSIINQLVILNLHRYTRTPIKTPDIIN